MMIEDVFMHHNALEKVSVEVLKRIVNAILGKYWWMKIEEIAYVFNQGKNGAYGRSNKNLSPDEILNWIHTYDTNERETEIIEANRRLQQTSNNIILSDEQLKEFYKNSYGVDNSEPLPDGSKRNHERQKGDSEYQKEKMRILTELKKDQENL